MQLQGKTALIAGASRNIGKAIALTFAREGADLILVARQMGDELNAVAQACAAMGVQVMPVLTDLSDPKQVDRLAEQSLARFGKVDTVVSVAAIRPHKSVWEIDYEMWHQVFALNVHATFYLAKAFAPGMMQRRSGSIVALGGTASLTAQPFCAHVVSSKTALYGLIKSLALELGPYGVRANLVAVGAIGTERRNPEWYPEGDGLPIAVHNVANGTALKRAGMPQEVANTVLFLASDQSSYVTGDRIVCAGGKFM